MKYTQKELNIIKDALFRQGLYWGDERVRNEGHNETRKKFCAKQRDDTVKLFNRVSEHLKHLAK